MTFIKWAGGKSKLLPHILPLLPERIKTYYEPFIGGGAVFFALARERRFDHAVISDSNQELIYAYLSVRDHVGDLIDRMAEHALHENDKDYFLEVRALDPESLSDVDRAARLIFLIKAGFNGLYRVNRSGQFNAAWGGGGRRVCQPAALTDASVLLRGVDIVCCDFLRAVINAGEGDAVYLDPPYDAIDDMYSPAAFAADDQRMVAGLHREIKARGAVCVASNRDTPLIRSLYDDWIEIDTHHTMRGGAHRVKELILL